MSIGENIRMYREKAGIQQKELAQKAGVSQAMICKVEKGLKMPSIPLGKIIAEELGCTLDDLAQ